MQGKHSVQGIGNIDNPGDNLWDNLLEAGIAIVVGLLVWVVLHYFIRILLKHAKSDRAPMGQTSMRWAAPMLRGIDPMIRALDHERRVQRAHTIGTLLNSILTSIVVVVTGFYLLLAFGVNIAPLLASVGVVGIAVGFGAQQLIRDFLAGIFITIEDQYGIGDVIQTSEVIGTVEYLGLRITRVMAEDGTLWYLRNGEILRLGNRSKGTYQEPAPEPEAPDSPSTPGNGAAPAPGLVPAPSTPLTNEPSESSE
ncbi:mechanosensitive ion channel protein MscS [Arthrobacter glacialis]|uniref:Mechanosensitive ion channel protein MscS n=1 Tax=Arthrobacter glacialis TaxID=1664 RepID=A0A2S3ZWY4_ARTGL|nr:mechanosensitive ion channel protein MscS [Arthrobacter glacialis]